MKLQHSITILFGLVLLINCASQRRPGGGPEDKTPPSIIRITPNPGATNVPTDTKIEILFSERMIKNTVNDAIFISPWPADEIFYKWKGKKLKIEFSDTLKTDRTYVLTIGAKSSDLRNNKMKDSFSLAFSTGNKIDEGHIGGNVYSQTNVEGTLVCAYSLDDNQNPDPSQVLADYYTQSNELGGYNLMYIAPGNYRLFAINDRDQNRKYTRGVDGIGITNFDVLLTAEEKTISKINFQMSIEDTVLLFVKSAYSIDQSKIAVRFSEPVKKFDYKSPQNYFTITQENDSTKSLGILSCYMDSRDPATFFFNTENQQPFAYNFETKDLFDKAGNGLDTNFGSVLFDGSAAPDTVKPVITFKSINDSTRGIKIDSTLQFVFSEPIQQEPFEHNFNFLENDTTSVAGTFSWINPATVKFFPDSSLNYLTDYTIKIPIDSISDIAGNFLDDSLNTIHFRTLSQDTLTAISGKINDQNPDGKGRIFLTAKSPKNSYATSLNKSGDYLFDNIFPGIYTISAFRDADSNSVYSFGKAVPFVAAERFIFYADSIKVRSRWPNEGNDIILE
ncbi:Ig-like domain-containing protein [candidate division KSB1 bacterium]|nr:Ig-like domain-containing protein [candidate division KSB1 bacterium]MBL7094729.1 Ig-like domain-containing protein [candidate division KSB1 bacterium]